MYVCLCHGIRCKDVREARQDGVCRAVEIFRQRDIKPQCGRCLSCIRDILLTPEDDADQPVERSRRAHPVVTDLTEGKGG